MAKNQHGTEGDANQNHKDNALYGMFLQWLVFWQLYSAATHCKRQSKSFMNLIKKNPTCSLYSFNFMLDAYIQLLEALGDCKAVYFV